MAWIVEYLSPKSIPDTAMFQQAEIGA